MRHLVLMLGLSLVGVPSVRADDWVIGYPDPNETVVQTTDRLVEGNIIILNNGRLYITGGAVVSVTGDILVFDAALLDVSEATVRFPQEYSYQSSLLAGDAARIRFADAVIEGGGRSHAVALGAAAAADFRRVTVENGFATWGFYDQATLEMNDCTNGGEFLTRGANEVSISGTETVLLWLTLPDGSVVDVALPPPGEVASFVIDPNTPWASGIPYTVALRDCTGVFWGVMGRSGSRGTFRDSELFVVGSLFERDNTIEVVGVANNAHLIDTRYDWGDVSLRFVDTSVMVWNYYALGSTRLTLQTCLFGEIGVGQTGEAVVFRSMCDGSGGYVFADGDGVLYLIDSANLSQTTARSNATLVAYRSALLSPLIDSTDAATMALLNSEYVGEPVAHDSATVFDAAIDPVDASAGEMIPLRGTARIISGPTSPCVFDSYFLEFGVGAEPVTWTPVAGPFFEQVRDGTLGTWNMCGRAPGSYTVRLALVCDGGGDPLTVESPATLREPPESLCAGDLDCDGQVGLPDLAVLLAVYGVDGRGDLNGDGETTLADLAALLANWGVCP